MNKDLNTLTIAAVTLVILSVGVLVGITVLTQTGNVMRTATVVSNETITATNNTVVSLTNAHLTTADFTAYRGINQTEVIATTDYTIDRDNGNIVNLDWDASEGTAWSVAYTYGASNTVVTTATLFIAGLVLFATFATLVALVIIGKIVIKLVREK